MFLHENIECKKGVLGIFYMKTLSNARKELEKCECKAGSDSTSSDSTSSDSYK